MILTKVKKSDAKYLMLDDLIDADRTFKNPLREEE